MRRRALSSTIHNVDKVYNYFTIEALEDGLTVKLTRNSSYYSIDNGDWVLLNSSTASPQINKGHTISFKISNPTVSTNYGIGTFTISKPCNLSGNILSLLYGDNFIGQNSLGGKSYVFYKLFVSCPIVSTSDNLLPATDLSNYCYSEMFDKCTRMVKAPKLPATNLTSSCYLRMFRYCSALKNAPELPALQLAYECYSRMFAYCTALTKSPVLPATVMQTYCYCQMFFGCSALDEPPILASTQLAESCYQQMFAECTALVDAPVLPATVLCYKCYGSMFQNCTSLQRSPDLISETLASWCYAYMFENCPSLVIAPELPATTLVDSCYKNMFNNCNKLNYIKMLATDANPSISNCLSDWTYNVASTGTFVKHPNMTSLPRGTSGIPSGWIVEDYA